MIIVIMINTVMIIVIMIIIKWNDYSCVSP